MAEYFFKGNILQRKKVAYFLHFSEKK